MSSASSNPIAPAENSPSPCAEGGPGFSLLWTIGFSGKRFLTDSEEAAVRPALKKAIEFLCAEARKQDSRLTAISSLARGGDVLFAEAASQPTGCGYLLQWKCLLPFPWDDFITRDLAHDQQDQPLTAQEAKSRRDRADACLQLSATPAEVTSHSKNINESDEREEAYLDCGYRTVDESDAMILLLRRSEIEALCAGLDVEANRPGTYSVARYALAAKRPMIVLPAEAADPWQEKILLNDPTTTTPAMAWFFDPMVTDVVRRAKQTGLPARTESRPDWITTPCGESVWRLQQCLGHLADSCQNTTQTGLKLVLRFHLGASTVAALMATVLAFEHPPALLWRLVPLLLLAFTKPSLAFAAWWLEHRLHHRGDREDWVHARVLQELCRGALALWPLPIQPLDANDEEDFPKVKRLIRSLRLLREQDARAAARKTPRLPRETQLEADMRVACERYTRHRLQHQAEYYGEKLSSARKQANCWRRGFVIATWLAIAIGLTLAIDLLMISSNHHLLSHALKQWLEALVIIFPFVAAHCLAMMTLLDCRRRENRYEEMRQYLTRLAETLARTQANPSRVRLIEHAERMMIEEQHEWFSVMRNLSV